MTTKLLALALLGACAGLPHVDPLPRGEDTQSAAAVTVEVRCGGSGGWDSAEWYPTRLASGVLVSERHVLTAAHVTTCPVIPAAWVLLADGSRLRMVVELEDLGEDVSRLVMASGSRLPAIAPPALADLLPGTWLSGGSGSTCVESAYPARVRACGDVWEWPFIDVPTTRGNSGAGAYDEGGRLVGLAVASRAGLTRIAPVSAKWLVGT